MVALDNSAPLVEALACRASELPVVTVVADARDFSLDRPVSLIVVPMQTLQLLGGSAGRVAFLSAALEQLEPGGLVAAALAVRSTALTLSTTFRPRLIRARFWGAVCEPAARCGRRR